MIDGSILLAAAVHPKCHFSWVDEAQNVMRLLEEELKVCFTAEDFETACDDNNNDTMVPSSYCVL